MQASGDHAHAGGGAGHRAACLGRVMTASCRAPALGCGASFAAIARRRVASAAVRLRAAAIARGARERRAALTIHEGVTEIVAVTEIPGRGRSLITNGHPMSSTALLDQRYMRALAHIPLLSMTRPRACWSSASASATRPQAATLHPSVERVDVADLSRRILGARRLLS